MGSEKFEKLCSGLIGEAFPEIVRSSLKRRRGQRQFGVDVESFDGAGNTTVVVSTKGYHEICAWDFGKWTKEFTTHLDGHWKDKGVRTFVLAVTHETNEDEMNAGAKALVMMLKDRGIEFRLWNAYTVSNLVAADPILVDRYFSEYWVQAISARSGVSNSSPAAPLAIQQDLAGQMSQLQQTFASFQIQSATSERVEGLMATSLEAAIGESRAGRPGAIERWVADARQEAISWSTISVGTRAKALRALAMIRLQRGCPVEASSLLDEADALSVAPDRAARALLARFRGTPRDALATPPWAVRLTIDLKQLCGREGDMGLSPPIKLAGPPPPGLWAGRDAVGAWVEAGWTSPEHPFATRDPSALAERLLAGMEGVEHRHVVPHLLVAVEPASVDADLLSRMRDAFGMVGEEEALEPRHAGMLRLMLTRALVFARLGETDAVMDLLRSQGARCRRTWPDERLRFAGGGRDADLAFSVARRDRNIFRIPRAMPAYHLTGDRV